MERWMKRTVEFGAGIAFTGKSNPSVIPYYPQKTEISGYEEQYFHRTAPEKVGVSSGRLLAMLKALEKEKRSNIHSLVCLKGGEVICECAYPGYGVNTWHLSHSMSKTVTGIAVGMLVDDGLLDISTPLYKLFPEITYNEPRFEQITVKHLLTMTTGVKFSETGSVTENKWTEAFFTSSFLFDPGTDFAYNSMNSYMLARIVVKLAGKSMMELLEERLFAPLKITNKFWELSAEGIEKGGWGLYMSAESWAKLGYMLLNGGVFDGKRILSEEWVKEATSSQAKTPDSLGHYNYGYHLWVSRDGEAMLFNGMFGQNVWVCPKNDMVVVIMSGNNELFQKSVSLAIIEKYLSTDLSNDTVDSCFAGDTSDLRYAERHFFESRHWIRPYESKRGISYRLGLRQRRSYPAEWEQILGKYSFSKNNCGIVPLIVRGMQNNFKSSIDGVELLREGESMFFVWHEGAHTHRVEIGFTDFKESVIDLRGEKYIVRVMGEAMEDEDRNMLFKLEILFPELPNIRLIKLSMPEEDKLLMRMSELPNDNIAESFLSEIGATNPKMAFVLDLIEKKVSKSVSPKKLSDTFSPRLIGARVGSERYTEIMDAEREKQKSVEKSGKVIDAVVDKLLRDDDDGSRGFIGEIVDRIRARMPQRKD